jgi:hypothetical protein
MGQPASGKDGAPEDKNSTIPRLSCERGKPTEDRTGDWDSSSNCKREAPLVQKRLID